MSTSNMNFDERGVEIRDDLPSYVFTTPPRKPHCCPVCIGSGKVSRPPWVPGDVPQWTESTTMGYDCNACNGSGIVWEP